MPMVVKEDGLEIDCLDMCELGNGIDGAHKASRAINEIIIGFHKSQLMSVRLKF